MIIVNKLWRVLLFCDFVNDFHGNDNEFKVSLGRLGHISVLDDKFICYLSFAQNQHYLMAVIIHHTNGRVYGQRYADERLITASVLFGRKILKTHQGRHLGGHGRQGSRV